MPRLDIFRFRISLPEDSKITKRSILAGVSMLYDPLGLVGPIIIMEKILLQKLWKIKVDWDDPISNDIECQWKDYKNQLSEISNIVIPRYVICPDTMDICGATLLVKLSKRVQEALNLQLHEIHYWSDSTITLAWINGEPSRWKTFVNNRVSMIQTDTKKIQWKHVRSDDNPADLISRGTSANTLSTSSLWWSVLDWLKLESSRCPSREISSTEIRDVPEERKGAISLVTDLKFDIFERSSSWTKLRRIVGYCKRFAENCRASKSGKERLTGPLRMVELERASVSLIMQCQKQLFEEEIIQLKKSLVVSSQSKLSNLHPFLDIDALLRVGEDNHILLYPIPKNFP